MTILKKPCECGKLFRIVRFDLKGEMCCYWCWKKDTRIIPPLKGIPLISLQDALNKTYEVKGYVYKNSVTCVVNFPTILANKKIKISLVEEKEGRG